MEAIEQPAVELTGAVESTNAVLTISAAPERHVLTEEEMLRHLIRKHPETAYSMKLTDSELWAYVHASNLKSVTAMQLSDLQALPYHTVQALLNSLVAKGYLQKVESRYEVMPEVSQSCDPEVSGPELDFNTVEKSYGESVRVTKHVETPPKEKVIKITKEIESIGLEAKVMAATKLLGLGPERCDIPTRAKVMWPCEEFTDTQVMRESTYLLERFHQYLARNLPTSDQEEILRRQADGLRLRVQIR